MNGSSNKDHFVPRFYLRKWAEGEFLWTVSWNEHSRELSWSNRATKAVAYQPGLYLHIEERFFKPLDTQTATFTELFNEYDGKKSKKQKLSEEDSDLWAKYLIAQYIRTPNNVDTICNHYKAAGVDSLSAKDNLPRIIESSSAISDLRNMLWIFATVSTGNEIITSDNPLIFKPKNLSHRNCTIILPMGPRSFFLATHQDNYDRLEQDQRKMVSRINQEIVMEAEKRLFMRSRTSISEKFIRKHWPICSDD